MGPDAFGIRAFFLNGLVLANLVALFSGGATFFDVLVDCPLLI
jgi:hypothetical protein